MRIFIGVMIFVCFQTSTFAEPVLWFGDGGAGLYTPSNSSGIIHAIDGGSRLMLIWNETAQSSGENSILYQIVTLDGEYELDSPGRISPPDTPIIFGSGGTHDNLGNFFLFWKEPSVNDPHFSRVFFQKIDSNGQLVWGEEGLFLDDFNDNAFWQATIAPNNLGGCYLLTTLKSYAMDSEGGIREDWRWHGQLIEGQRGLNTIDDGEGGFWMVFNVEDDEYVWGHLDYSGARVEDQPVAGGGRAIAGYEGGLIETSTSRNPWPSFDSLGVLRIDERGQYMGGEFHHKFRVERNIGWTDDYKLPSGKIILVYGYYNVMLYDPISNSLPWGMGFRVGIRAAELFSAMELQAGMEEPNILLIFHALDPEANPAQRFYLRVVRPDGELVGNDFDHFDGFGDRASALPDGEGGFWLYGMQSYGYFERHRYLLNRFDSAGNRQFEHDIESPFEYKNGLDGTYTWFDERGVFHTLFSQYTKGIYHIGLNTDGEVVGDPDGRLVVPADSFGLEAVDPQGLTLNERVLYLYRPSHHDTLLPPRLLSFSLSGRLQWTINLDNGFPDIWGYAGMAVDPEQQTAAVLLRHRDPEDISVTKTYVVGVNLADGRRIWQRDGSFRWTEWSDRQHRIVSSGNSFYTVAWQLSDSIYVDKFDADGATDWIEPYAESSEWPIRVFDAAPDGEGGLWVGKWATVRELDSTVVWLTRIGINGERVGNDRAVYALPGQHNENYPLDTESLALITSGRNLWIVPYFSTYLGSNLGVQCLNQDGDMLLGPLGWQPQVIGRYNNSFYADGDREGGLWFFWNNQLDMEVIPRAIHLGEQGEVKLGWPAEGLVVSEQSGYLINSIHRLWDGSYSAVLAGLSPSGTSSQYRFEYIGEHDPAEVSEAEPNPSEFRLTGLYPQPFNDRLRIEFTVPSAGKMDLKLFDLQGRTVIEESFTADKIGHYSRPLQLADQTSGVYFLRLQFENYKISRKIVLLK